MIVSEEILLKYHSKIIRFEKNETLFEAGNKCEYFYQVKTGSVKMVSFNEDGREYTQGIFKSGESFAEPALLCEFPYPATIIAIEKSDIWKCSKHYFYLLLKENFEIHLSLTEALGYRLKYKSMMLEEISLEDARHRLLSIIDFYKNRSDQDSDTYKVEFSRQELANMTGLRVETVIRTIKKLEEEGHLQIREGKIYRCSKCDSHSCK